MIPTMPCLCEVCDHDVLPHHHSVSIGEGKAHVECAADSSEVLSCCLCGQLTLVDNAGDWRRHPEGRMCPACFAETEPVASLAGMIRQVTA